MIIQYKKPILIVLCSLLTFIATVAIIHYYNKDNFEWGNVSDWLSSLSTFATLLVAYGAFIKAPDWLFQKRYEVASRIIDETIFNGLPKLNKLCTQYKFQYQLISKQLTRSLNGKVFDEQRLNDSRTELNKIFSELFSLAISMSNELKVIKRNGFEFTEYASRIYNELINIASTYNTLDTKITCCILDAIDYDLSDETDPQKLLNSIFNLSNQLMDLSQSFNAFIHQVRDDNKMDEDFIIPIKK